jgi:hypothetical protein
MSQVVKYPVLDLARLRPISVVSSLDNSLLGDVFQRATILRHAPIVVFVCDGTYVTRSVPSCGVASLARTFNRRRRRRRHPFAKT